jgi:hypothetical protein
MGVALCHPASGGPGATGVGAGTTSHRCYTAPRLIILRLTEPSNAVGVNTEAKTGMLPDGGVRRPDVLRSVRTR